MKILENEQDSYTYFIETLQYGTSTTQSDVWSYGVTLWELFAKGSMPYVGMSNGETSQKVIEGYRLPQPPSCPDDIYKLMLSCWNAEPEKRPSFSSILVSLNEIQKMYKVDPVLTEVGKRKSVMMNEILYN